MNKLTIIIEDDATQDIQNTIDYNNKQQSGLGKKFHAFIIDAFEILKINPFFKTYKNDIRCMALLRFPFSVFYIVNEEDRIIHVYAVLH